MVELLDGLPFDESSARRLRRVAWDDYCDVTERIEAALGGPEELEKLCQDSYHHTIHEFRVFAGTVVSPKALCRLVFEVIDPLIFPTVEFSYCDLDVNRFRLLVHLRPGVRPCKALFTATLGSLRGFPGHLALPAAEVSGEYDGVKADWDVVLPPSRTLFARAQPSGAAIARTLKGLILGYDHDAGSVEMSFGSEVAAGAEARLALAIERWQITRRQVDVLQVLVRGKTNKEIANILQCAENTVELHVTQLLRRAGVSSRGELIARFWSDT